ncbi:ATP-dependent DNA helicase MER3 [Savitreella phatthalungensis]
MNIGGIDVGELKDKVRDTLGSLLAQSHYKIANTLARILSSTIDVAADKQDTITLLHALELRTAVLARCWQNTPGTLRQVRGIGKVSLQALKLARIVSIKQLAVLDSFELERIFRRNPPFGVRMLEDLASFPQFTVQLEARSHKRLAEFIMVGIHLSLTPLPTSAKEMRNNGRAVFITFSEENQLVDFAQVP